MSGEPKEQSIIGQIMWRVLIVLIAVSVLFYLFLPIWTVGPVQVILHTLLAFLAIIGAAVLSYDIHKNSVIWKYVFLSFFLFTAIVNFVAAVWSLNPLYVIAEIVEVSADLVEMLLLGLLILGALVPTRLNQSETSVKHGLILLLILTFGALFGYGALYYFLIPFLLVISPVLTGFGLGSICFVIFTVIFVFLSRQSHVLTRFDIITLITGLILMVASTICLLISFLQPIMFLSASIMLRAAMLYAFFIAIAIPIQKDSNITESRAHIYATTLAFLVVIPYGITLLVISFIPLSSVFMEQGIYTLTHLIVAVVAAIIVRLLWHFTKQQPHWHRYPMILVFVTVTIVESAILFLSPWVELTGEYTLLYVIAGLIIVFWLYFALRWIYHPPTNRKHEHMVRWLAFYSAIVLIVVLAGVWLQNILFLILPLTTVQGLTRISLLAVCFASMFFVTYLFVIFVKVTEGRVTMGLIVLGTLSLWIIANILRVLFPDWTAGWWIAQFFFLFGFLMAPATLGRLYLSTLERSERERKRATLYADILVHDLRNYHTVIQSSLDLLTLSQDPSEVVDAVTENIQVSLNRAARLITNVRSLELASSLKPQDLSQIDLVSVINEAWDHVQDPDEEPTEFTVNRQQGDCFVQANELLLEVFVNLFRNAIQYTDEAKRIHVTIEQVDVKNVYFWEIRVTDWSRGIAPEQREKLFTRYTEGAKGLGLGLSVVKSLTEAFGGSVHIENRVKADYTQGSIFIILLPQSI